MRDKRLEHQIEQVEQFVEMWKEFHRLFTKALGQQEITPDDEQLYFDIKTGIARNYNVLMESLGMQKEKDSKALDIITQVVTLADASALSEGMAKRVTSVWHEKYIEFQKILGALEHNLDELAHINRFTLFLRKLFFSPISIVIYVLIIATVVYFIFFKEKFPIFENSSW
ncbi:MAG: hypothetical protein RBU23_00140 [Candidatus Auribacterota bacterium]|nr:hypothetical protein [Candidatus Auribacterota bacterium]